MKRVKRLFACLLALTMMLGLSATAFATETAEKVQTPANGGTVTFEKEYKLVGEGISCKFFANFQDLSKMHKKRRPGRRNLSNQGRCFGVSCV